MSGHESAGSNHERKDVAGSDRTDLNFVDKNYVIGGTETQDFESFRKSALAENSGAIEPEIEGHQYQMDAEKLFERANAFLADYKLDKSTSDNPTSIDEDLSYQIGRLRELQNIVPSIISDDEKVAVGYTVAKLVAMKEKIVATIN